ncbi:MAG: hypothetical protein KME50_16190 [Nostoc desertorum CM1-VF14]|jgi:hypothetical protein|nr:hypothetical protein [Nostoc desertorum CM1-VF14]
MQVLTLSELFGINALQTATELIIRKADLMPVGLTPVVDNRSEQLFVAILLKALENFQGTLTDENNSNVVDENNSPIEHDNRSLWELLDIFKWDVYIPEEATNKIRNEIIIHSFTHANQPLP